MGFLDNIKSSFRKGSSVTKLIYINATVFLLISVTLIIGYLLNNQDIPSKTIDLLSVPASLKSLAHRPWTLVTYMFTHKDIWHILFNMLWLYWFGIIFLEYLDQKKLVSVYLLGGLCGAVTYIISFNIFPAFKDVVDESVALGIKYVALAIFVLTSIMDFSVNSGGKLAHFGGALFGLLYSMNIKRGNDLGKGVNKIIDFFATLFKPRKKLKVTYKKPVSDYDYNKMKTDHQEKINIILDKISKGGYESLSKEEKETLFKESQKKN
jgi:membrane associated rhomboid family serine protease